MIKKITGTGLMWVHYLQTGSYAYNNFASPALHGLSPLQLTYGRPHKFC